MEAMNDKSSGFEQCKGMRDLHDFIDVNRYQIYLIYDRMVLTTQILIKTGWSEVGWTQCAHAQIGKLVVFIQWGLQL
jgi:hypothetical protein